MKLFIIFTPLLFTKPTKIQSQIEDEIILKVLIQLQKSLAYLHFFVGVIVI